jgi:plastocyanin domain-containing protein
MKDGVNNTHRQRKSSSNNNNKIRNIAVASIVVLVVVGFVAYSLLGGSQDSGVISKSQIPSGTPVYQIVEGQQGYAYPYYPDNVTIPSGKMVVISLTDNIGGCGLETIFQNLGVHGGNAVANVPVGSTEYVEILAPSAGTYSYHCGSNMYYGNVLAS